MHFRLFIVFATFYTSMSSPTRRMWTQNGDPVRLRVCTGSKVIIPHFIRDGASAVLDLADHFMGWTEFARAEADRMYGLARNGSWYFLASDETGRLRIQEGAPPTGSPTANSTPTVTSNNMDNRTFVITYIALSGTTALLHAATGQYLTLLKPRLLLTPDRSQSLSICFDS